MIGLGLGIPSARQLTDAALDAYIAAVEDDGGTVESPNCVRAVFGALRSVKVAE